MRVASTFNDYYDSGFDLDTMETPTFVRVDDIDPPKDEILAMLDTWYDVPQHARVNELTLEGTDKVIVFQKENLATFKYLLPVSEAQNKYPMAYATQYIETSANNGEPASIWRYIQVGDRAWWLNQVSEGAYWNSSYGMQYFIGESMSIARSDNSPLPLAPNLEITYPLFRVDFVLESDTQKFYAIDFHANPLLRGTGIDDVLTPTQVVDLLAARIETLGT